MYSLTLALGTVPEMTRGTGLRSETRRGEPNSLLMLSEDLPLEIFGRLRARSSPRIDTFADEPGVD